MTISKETGVKLVKVGLAILTPTVILILILLFLYWRKKKRQKLADQLRGKTEPEAAKQSFKEKNEQVDNI